MAVKSFLVPKNNAISTLNGGVTDVATLWTVADGSKFPSTFPFHVSCESEIAKCTARSGNDLTVTRAQEGTTNVAHATGLDVELLITALALSEIQDAINTLLFGTVAAQTLAAADAITVTDGIPVRLITTTANRTLTSQPTIAAGRDGQVVYVHNVGTFILTLQDVNALGGSLLRLSANTLAINPGGTMGLVYDATLGFWCQFSLVNPQTFTPSIATFTVDGYSVATREVGGASSLEDTSPTNHTKFDLTYVGTPSATAPGPKIDIDGGEINGADYPVTLLTPFLQLLTQPNWYRGTTIGGTRIFTATVVVAGETKTKTITITYFNSRYAGVNTQNTALTSAQTVALGILATDNAYQTLSKAAIAATGSNYIWYCYRSALGITNLFFGVNWKGDGTERAQFNRVGTGTVSVTNASNFVETFEQFVSAIQGINSLVGAAGTSTLALASTLHNNRISMGPGPITDPITTANIRALDDTADGESNLQSTVAGTYTAIKIEAGEYLWFCHPAAISDLATIKDGTTGFSIAGSYRTNVSHTNDLGYVETYRCWRSDNAAIYPTGENIVVT